MKDFQVNLEIIPHTLQFKFDAGTSRGVLKSKITYLLKATSLAFPGIAGYGEAGPLLGLSLDDRTDFYTIISEKIRDFEKYPFPNQVDQLLEFLNEKVPSELPSLRFGLETALLDLIHGGNKRIMANDFFDQNKAIPINGLIWMGTRDFMITQIQQKIAAGFRCIKIKVGAIDFDQECAILRFIRSEYDPEIIDLRVDANGAFTIDEAPWKLEALSNFSLHSIEQPIKAGNWKAMAHLCHNSPVPIALDEELIGVTGKDQECLLDDISPQFIILKPTLLGGIMETRKWIHLAEEKKIGWWMTSALESNIGLNAIAQFTSTFNPEMPQGLGTGQLYQNNITSPLQIEKGALLYNQAGKWEL